MPQDILLDSSLNVVIKDGDFAIGESTDAHQLSLMLSVKGDYKETPVVGMSLVDLLNDDQVLDARQEIQKQMELDGMTVNSLKLTADGKITFDAEYDDD
jgi:hypothetical protein